MLDTSRLQKELVECNRDAAISGVSIALHDGAGDADLTHLCGTISRHVDTPYEGGTFVIDIQLPSCRSIGRQLRMLEVEDGYGSVKSGHFNGVFVLGEDRDNGRQRSWYLQDYQKFVGTALLWTESFAKTATISMDDKKLVEMGFPEDIVRNVLKAFKGDENKALEKLCSG
ncbi:hypothetical protein HPP92_025004 [Vanilla planifolia]|uniref:UBA domain-containing protein n=1 Tax=Vanilla planifolia TaxID=51239 RepID=A0A835UA74_VANPL|nr:hypothetical protein HPP92_025004 [Vanilla planifolia]